MYINFLFILQICDLKNLKFIVHPLFCFQAAYRGNTLGLPHRCPKESIQKIDKRVLYTYMKNFHTPERMVLAGVGVDHDKFVRLAEDAFIKQKTPIWLDNPDLIDSRMSTDNSLSQYTGGKVLVSGINAL